MAAMLDVCHDGFKPKKFVLRDVAVSAQCFETDR